MTRLTQTLLARAGVVNPLPGGFASDFSPAEIRQAIAELVANQHTALAEALCEAGLALYPDSEDIVSISALLAELRQDWPAAQQHLEKLLELQGQQTKALAWRHLIRVLRCQLDLQQALVRARLATQKHPSDKDLQTELTQLLALTVDIVPSPAAEMAH